MDFGLWTEQITEENLTLGRMACVCGNFEKIKLMKLLFIDVF